jgi:ribosome biogenesis GTPase
MLFAVNGHEGLILYGWDDRVAARLAAVESPDGLAARVIAVHRGACTVTTGEGDQRVRGRVVAAVGDWVSAREKDGQLTLPAVAERWSALTRRDPEGLTQVLAANVDIVFVMAPADRLSPSRIERETVMAWDSGARPIVLLGKSDLAPARLAEDVRNRLVGVDVIPTSIVTGEGIEAVRAALRPARTAVLLGPSGAGKSSLANVLLGAERLATEAVRSQDRRGRHKTTVRQLLVVPTGGLLIDTPGLRSLSLAEDKGGIAAAFPDIEALALECRFSDCRHDQEPGCAVLAAVDGGTLDRERLASYRKLAREREYEVRRDDPLAASATARIWKTRTKELRRLYRDRRS